MTVTRHPNNNGVSLQQWRKAAAGGETTLSGTDDFSAGLSYTVGAEQVFVNGVLLERGVDYAATTGTTITGLTALVAGDIATVASPSSFSVANAIPKATVTAKGDLIAGTGASTVSNLAVGADGTTLVADSSTSTGLRYQGSMAGGKNAIINGGMDIWQRGTTVAGATNGSTGYAADRWQVYRGAYAAGATLTRQVTSDTTNLPFIQYCARVQRDSGNTSTATMGFSQNLESSMAIPYAGKTVVVSFYARAGANYSSASSAFTVNLYNGTGTDQNGTTGSGYTGSNSVISQAVTLTTTWQRFSVTATIPSNATEFYTNFGYTPVGTAGANDYFEVTGVQVEVGSVPTQFTRASGTIQGELAACQRYYWRNTASNAYTWLTGMGVASSTTVTDVPIQLPVTMRVFPTTLETGNVSLNDDVGSLITATFTFNTANSGNTTTTIRATATGLTAYRAYNIIANNNSAAYIGFSAEL